MTNQEAAEYLDKYVMNIAPYGKWKEVIERAISALQAQEAKTQLSREDTTSDLISRQAAIDALCSECQGRCIPCDSYPCSEVEAINALPTAQPNLQPTCNRLATDCISRHVAIDILNQYALSLNPDKDSKELWKVKSIKSFIEQLPSAQPEWNNHTVACLLAELFDDTCACNYNGIDEWLPEKCEVIDACPNPVGVACWEQFLKHRAERRTDAD